MKLKLSLLAAMACLSLASNAQKIGKCASHEYLQHLDKLNPGMEEYVKNLPNQIINANGKATRAATITVPVVVHIVYKNATENLTDDYINAQIDMLNKSFLRKNADTINLRSEFLPYAGAANIQFMLVQTIRSSTAVPKFNYIVDLWGNNAADNVKLTSGDGDDAVTPDKKLNLWICDLGDDVGDDNLLGYAYPPSGLPNWGGQNFPSGAMEGVVIDFMAIGGAAKAPKGAAWGLKGKTAVHEFGHYLGLRHIWGDDDGACAGNPDFEDDGISDTPHAGDMSNSDCNKNKNTCNQGAGDLKDMVENYMDYSSELCQNSFTKLQVSLMESVLNNQRLLVRVPTKVEDYDFSANLSVYPNPADDIINVGILNLKFNHADVFLINHLGQTVKSNTLNNSNTALRMDVQDLSAGVYFLKIVLDDKYISNQKVLIQ